SRRSAQEMIGEVLRKVPLGGVVSNVESLRENILAIFAHEISRVLSKVDLQRLTDHVIKHYSLRVEARIDLVPKNRSVKKKGKK
ncbi:MAG: hypothetical protein ACXVBE_14660, partial [Bdellovibrionota bacterium]